MFCGWQLIHDFDELQRLKSGKLEIDVKNGTCNHNGEENQTLTMPLVLNNWFLHDLEKHNIALSDIGSASLVVEFNMNKFGVRGGESPEFICTAKLQSGDTSYKLEFQGECGENEVQIT